MDDDEDDYVGDFGTHPKFMHRKDGHETTVKAAYGVDSVKLEEKVWKAILSFGSQGAIHDQIADVLVREGVHYDSIAPRYSALLDKGYIRDTGVTAIGHSGYEQRVVVGLPIPIKPIKKERRTDMISLRRINSARKNALKLKLLMEKVPLTETEAGKIIEKLIKDILLITQECLDEKLLAEGDDNGRESEA